MAHPAVRPHVSAYIFRFPAPLLSVPNAFESDAAQKAEAAQEKADFLLSNGPRPPITKRKMALVVCVGVFEVTAA